MPEPAVSATPGPRAGKTVYSVSQLNRRIRSMLETEFPSLWVEAEISNFKHHTSGHMYLTIKDDRSQMNAVFFSRYNHALKFELKDGMQVLLYGRISVYEPRGQYQFYIERAEPKGVGALQLAFLQMKERLEKEGLFDEAHKKPIPRFPRRVGVVTSPTGAAIRDILNVISRRFVGTEVLIAPVRVQGEGAAGEIAAAIDDMNAYGKADVLIVGRGGGSLEDLWAFNEEAVARAIFRSAIPVISAVGHEIDWSIADLAADLRAPTPSAAAELVVQDREELENRLRQNTSRLSHAARSLLEGWQETLRGLQESYAFRQPGILIEQFSQRMDEYVRQLQNYLKTLIGHKEHEFRALVGRLEALSPLQILERGYSLNFLPSGKLLKDIAEIKKGDRVHTRLANGKFTSIVEKIES